jgi:nicotinamidase-related amidase
MKNVVNLRSYANKSVVPTLVLLDMQQEYTASPRMFAIPHVEAALENCRRVLRHARLVGLPVAFLRMVGRSPFFNPALSYSRWISGFEPVNSDMVFERSKPSCYASREFANAMTEGGGHFVLAGFSGEAACLSTVMEAFHRDHHVTFLADASASHGLDQIAPQSVHETVVQLIGLFGEVTTANQWICGQTSGAVLRVR